MKTLDLFDPPYQAHSETSRDAAEAIQCNASTLRMLVFSYIRLMGSDGATDEEIQDFLGIAGSTQRPRRCELVKAGKVVDSGLTRKTKSGRSATIWRAA